MPHSSGVLPPSHFGQTIPPDIRGQFDNSQFGYLECEDSDKAATGDHVLVPDRGSTNSTNKPCVYCKLRGVKTTTGLPIKSYWKCNACNLPMCRPRQRDCFRRYHLLLQNVGSEAQSTGQSDKDITGLLA
ncbi:hypothetical protein KP79_PYT18777 [Mizuhopecten yessoensis]|uniref:PiggyBac transposable element-derived protein 4 C-terminal zinc-finger domain-containing protein n=1 Tax=Mizuhopecten yessoensis TaxID=6573 RepID=A0A210Q3F1_MIZYE|nr:hypothetical protein KP79_PYT18777 [Mizuhopecten yessoensis]